MTICQPTLSGSWLFWNTIPIETITSLSTATASPPPPTSPALTSSISHQTQQQQQQQLLQQLTKTFVIQRYAGPLWWNDKFRVLLLVDDCNTNGYIIALSPTKEDVIANWEIIKAVYLDKVEQSGLSTFSASFLLQLYKKLAKKMAKVEGGLSASVSPFDYGNADQSFKNSRVNITPSKASPSSPNHTPQKDHGHHREQLKSSSGWSGGIIASPSMSSQLATGGSSSSFNQSISSSNLSFESEFGNNSTAPGDSKIGIGRQRRVAMLFRVLYSDNSVSILEKTFSKQFPDNTWVEWMDERTGMRPIHVAVERQDVPLIKYLLDRNVDTSSKDTQGWSPLHFSAFAGNLDICQLLIEQGSAVMSISKDGTLPLHYLARHTFEKPQSTKFFAILELLLAKGTPIDAKTIRGETAMHRACFFGSMQVVSFLIDHGAQLNIQNKRGETPLYFAVIGRHKQIVTMLVENGADCILGGATGNSLDASKMTDQTDLFYFLCGFAQSLESFQYNEEDDEVEYGDDPNNDNETVDSNNNVNRKEKINGNQNDDEKESQEAEEQTNSLQYQLIEKKLKEKKEKLKINHHNFYPHIFVLTDFRGPTWCSLCGYFLWGFRKQGFSCEACGYICHPKCKKKAILQESCMILKDRRNETQELTASTNSNSSTSSDQQRSLASSVNEYLSSSGQQHHQQPLVKQSINRRRLESLYNQFNQLDKEQQGCIHQKEFGQCLGTLISESKFFYEALFNAFDSNHDGKMDLKDFLRGVSVLQNSSFDEQIKFAFSMLDINRRGYITLREFIYVLESIQNSLSSLSIKIMSPQKIAQHIFPENLIYNFIPTGFVRSKGGNRSELQRSDQSISTHRILSLSSSSIHDVTNTTSEDPTSADSSTCSSPLSLSPMGHHHHPSIGLKTSSLPLLPQSSASGTSPPETNIETPKLNRSNSTNNVSGAISSNTSGTNTTSTSTSTTSTTTNSTTTTSNSPINTSQNMSQSLPANLKSLMAKADEKKFSRPQEYIKQLNLEAKITFEDYKKAMVTHSYFVQSMGVIETDNNNTSIDASLKSSRETNLLRKWMSFEGKEITLGHESWETMQFIMIGIRRAIGETITLPSRPLKQKDFELIVEFKYNGWTFKDHSPFPFKRIREILEIDSKYFMFSLGPEKIFGNLLLGNLSNLCEVVSSGRSGSNFFRSNEGRYLIKTIPPNEETVLKTILPSYLQHLIKYPNSLLAKTLGYYSMFGAKDYRFLVMNNLFYTPLPIHEKYDLKGSTVGRHVEAPTDEDGNGGVNPDLALKDLDFKRKINIGPEFKAPLMEQIEHDTKLLESHNICDYSLLVGVHRVDEYSPIALASDDHFSKDIFTVLDEGFFKKSSGKSPIFQQHYGGILSSDKKEVYFIAIIDIFTTYDFRKKYENMFKSLVHDSNKISAIDPVRYRKRFQQLIQHIVE